MPVPPFIAVKGPCDLRCAWCNYQGTRLAPASSHVAEVLQELERLFAAGHRTVGFGLHSTEPTTHPELLGIIERARRVGFTNITLSSSGLKLADRAYARALHRAGLTAVILSFVAVDPPLSDLLLGQGGATAAKLQAWANCLEVGFHSVASIMLLRPTLPLVSEVARRLQQMAASAGDRALIHGCVMDPVAGTPQARAELLWPRLGEIAWAMEQIRAVVAGFTAQSSVLPACMAKHVPGLESGPRTDVFARQRIATARPARPCARCTQQNCAGIPSIFLDAPVADALAKQQPRTWTASDLAKEIGHLDEISGFQEPLTAETWQVALVARLEHFRTTSNSIAGFYVMGIWFAPNAVRCELRTDTQRLLAILERREHSPRHYLAGARYTVSYGSETPLKTEAQRKALQALLEGIESH